MPFNPNKPPVKKNGKEIIGTIDLNSKAARKETKEAFVERKNAEKGNGVKAGFTTNKTKYDRKDKYPDQKFK